MVHSAAMAGLEAFCLRESDYKRLDTFILGKIRKIMHGKACKEVQGRDGQVHKRAETTKEVWKYIKLAPSKVELQIRRLQYWQLVAAHKDAHKQVLAAVFGQMPVDD